MSRANRWVLARVFVLGLNAWVVLIVIPGLLGPERSLGLLPSSIVLCLLPVVVLTVGLGSLVRRGRTAWPLLLLAFPLLVAGVSVELTHADVSPSSFVESLVGAISLAAFLLYTAGVLSTPRAQHETTVSELRSGEKRSRHHLSSQRVFIAGAALGSLMIAVVAPALSRSEAYLAAWGKAAAEAKVMVAVGATMISVAIMTLFVAPTTRKARPGTSPQRRHRHGRVRVALFLFVVALGAIALWLIAEIEGRSAL